MPKVLEYPQASFAKCRELADAVEALGGSCSAEMCAKKLNKQHTSGAWSMLAGSAGKFDLVENKRGLLTVTDRYKKMKFAYTLDEKQRLLRDAFFLPPVFSALLERFKGRELPVALLDKMLVREFGVEEAAASRVSGYFIDGLKEFGLLDSNAVLSLPGFDETPLPAETSEPKQEPQVNNNQKADSSASSLTKSFENLTAKNEYVVRLSGPGLDHTFNIVEDEDFEMVNIFLKKVRKALSVKAQNTSLSEPTGDTSTKEV